MTDDETFYSSKEKAELHEATIQLDKAIECGVYETRVTGSEVRTLIDNNLDAFLDYCFKLKAVNGLLDANSEEPVESETSTEKKTSTNST